MAALLKLHCFDFSIFFSVAALLETYIFLDKKKSDKVTPLYKCSIAHNYNVIISVRQNNYFFLALMFGALSVQSDVIFISKY